MSMKRLHLFIHGHVQGVTFRSFILSQAKLYKLSGWVKNTPEGVVEMVAEGEEVLLLQLLKAARKGPRWAEVSALEEEWQDVQEKSFSSFEII